MKDDLKKLLISEHEMYAVNGLGETVDALREYRGSLGRSVDNALRFLALLGGLGLAAIGAIALSIAYYYEHRIPPIGTLPGVLALLGSGALLLTLRVDFEGRFILGKYGAEAHGRYRNYLWPEPLQERLFGEVQRFNKLVRAIHVSDAIDAAGVPGSKIQDRESVLRSMATARTDLIRALKLERIMRENADISNTEFQLFEIDLTHLAAMQVEDAATQQGKLMNEAFQIARTVQMEVRKLQTHDRQETR